MLPVFRQAAGQPDSRPNPTTRKAGHAVEGTHCLEAGRHPDFPTAGGQPDWREHTHATARNGRKEVLDSRQLKNLPVATQPKARGAGGAAGIRNPQDARSERDRRATTQPPHTDSRIAKTWKEGHPNGRDGRTFRRPDCRERDNPSESHATARLRQGRRRAANYRHTGSKPQKKVTASEPHTGSKTHTGSKIEDALARNRTLARSRRLPDKKKVKKTGPGRSPGGRQTTGHPENDHGRAATVARLSGRLTVAYT